MAIAVVLYEDSQARNNRNYGPHIFVVRCVADQVSGVDAWRLRDLFEAHPMNGATKLLDELDRNACRYLNSAREVIVVLDSDEIRKILRLGTGAATQDVVTAVRSHAPADADRSRIAVFLLERNMEAIVSVVAKHIGRNAAGCHKPAVRDSILLAATDPTNRKRVLDEEPSLKALVDHLAALAPVRE